MTDMLKINVNDHTEKKNGLTYLTWAWAWAEVLKIDPQAEWKAVEYPRADGTLGPCILVGDGTALVKTEVTINAKTRSCVLPVMDHRNKAIKNPDAFAINTAIMRCMTKAISMHGLGLYIYAGEDLPEGEEPEGDRKPERPTNFRSSPLMDADGRKAIDLLPADQQDYIRDMAMEIVAIGANEGWANANAKLVAENLDNEQKMALWSILDSKTRTALTKVIRENMKVAA